MAGVAYAFGPGMSPMAKESAREHLPTYFAGVAYHAGILAGLVCLGLVLAGVEPAGLPLRAIQALCLLGALCRRGPADQAPAHGAPARAELPGRLRGQRAHHGLRRPGLRDSLRGRPSTPALLAEAAILLLYAPLGKIKHCIFFFPSRYYLGAHFGRRGTFPPRA